MGSFVSKIKIALFIITLTLVSHLTNAARPIISPTPPTSDTDPTPGNIDCDGERLNLGSGAVRAGYNLQELAGNDDGSTEELGLPFSFNFFGETFNSLYLNNNGNVTFDSPLRTFTPFDLTSTQSRIIAAHFSDIDTRGTGCLTYDTEAVVDDKSAFVATWYKVGYFSNNVDLVNTFQLVLIDRSDIRPGDFDIEFNYDQILWETGDASGGTNGLGGSPARVGFSNGTGDALTFFELRGSANNGEFLDGGRRSLVANSFNSDIPGRYIYPARSGRLFGGSPNTGASSSFLPAVFLLLNDD